MFGRYVALPQECKAVKAFQEVCHSRCARFHRPRQRLQHLRQQMHATFTLFSRTYVFALLR